MEEPYESVPTTLSNPYPWMTPGEAELIVQGAVVYDTDQTFWIARSIVKRTLHAKEG
jgi:hypothetical protein